MPALVINKITKDFGKTRVLDQVSLNVEEGEIFGLLGPNGAGKSTMIKVLLGFEKASSGDFAYYREGKKVSEPETKKTVSIVPQKLCFYRNFSVEKNLEVMGSLYGLRGKKLSTRIEALLERWNLKSFRRKKASHLSGGYQRLLNIACGLINDPSIIFLDEPTVGLDPKIRKAFWKKISGLKQQGKTVLLTTHYMDEAEYLCGRIALIVKGKIRLVLSVPEIRKRKISVEDVFLRVTQEEGVKREDI
jgi:ABC-2 type transport system ATP-binding protein